MYQNFKLLIEIHLNPLTMQAKQLQSDNRLSYPQTHAYQSEQNRNSIKFDTFLPTKSIFSIRYSQ